MREVIRGTLGADRLLATETIRESVYGRNGDDELVFFRGGYTGEPVDPPLLDPDFSDRFFGGRGDDKLTGLQLTFFSEDDYDAYQQASFDGGAGTDSIVFGVDLSVRAVNSLTLERFAALTRNVEIREFDVTATASTTFDSVVDFYGSADNETVRLTVDQSGEMAVNARLGSGADRFEINADRDVDLALSVHTGNGADTVIVNATTTRNSDTAGAEIVTGRGNDTVVLEGMHSETVSTGSGNDDIYVLTGSFALAPDEIYTGTGKDRVFVELDAYSQVAELRDFQARHDVIVFDRAETRDIEVVFDKDDWDTGETPNLFMNNATGQLFYGDNLMIDFGGSTRLTADNFEIGTWEF